MEKKVATVENKFAGTQELIYNKLSNYFYFIPFAIFVLYCCIFSGKTDFNFAVVWFFKNK